jgi:hypothetical protein
MGMNVVIVIIFIIILIILVLLIKVNKFVSGGGMPHRHDIGDSLHKYACGLLTDERPTALKRGGNGHAKGRKVPWHAYKTWEALHQNDAATTEYFAAREKLIKNPNLDWSEVLKVMTPKLKDTREFIGIINLKNDGKTLYVESYEAAPESDVNTSKSDLYYASVPSKLVSKYADKPGLIIFHTHPADIKVSPLPSSNDLSAAIYLGAASRFAASVVISRYGVVMYGLDWPAYDIINNAEDWKLATLNMSYDIVAAHESIRSWRKYTLNEYLDFYPKYNLFAIVFPSPEFIADNRRGALQWNIEAPTDNELVQRHLNDIKNHIKNRKRAKNTLNVEEIRFD